MGIPKFLLRFIGSSIGKKLELQEDDKMIDTKKWWKSKTILSAGVAVLVGLYNLVDLNLGPALGFDLPAIPEWIFIVLGAVGVYGRVGADKKIG